MKKLYRMKIKIKGDERKARGVEKLLLDRGYEIYDYRFHEPNGFYKEPRYELWFRCDLQTKNDIAEFLELKNKYQKQIWEF